MNTNNISKDGRLYVAACRVIDNFRYEHISKKPQKLWERLKKGKASKSGQKLADSDGASGDMGTETPVA